MSDERMDKLIGKTAAIGQQLTDFLVSFNKHENDGKLRFEKLEEQIDKKIGSCPYNGDIKLMKKVSYTIIMLVFALIVKSWVVPLITKIFE